MVSQDPQVAIEWYLEHGVPLTNKGGHEEVSITQRLTYLPSEFGGKPLEWLDQQMKGGAFSAEALEIVRNSSRSGSESSWMGLYAHSRPRTIVFR